MTRMKAYPAALGKRSAMLRRLAFGASAICMAGAFADDHVFAQCGNDVPLACINGCEAYGDCIIRCEIFGLCESDTATECWFRENDFRRCYENNVPVQPLPTGMTTFPPWPSCPTGEHRDGNGCQADHVCGDDEIGDGGTDCEPCGEGLVPNLDETACHSCPYGESGTSPGVCAADPCGLDAVDFAATEAMGGIPREPRERGVALFCLDDEIDSTAWVTSPATNACTVGISVPYGLSCWSGSSRSGGGCDLASIHTHPYFTEADRGTLCHGDPIDEQLAILYNNGSMDFSGADLSADNNDGVDGYLGVSDRSCAKANRIVSGGAPGVVAGTCTPTPLPHTPWRRHEDDDVQD